MAELPGDGKLKAAVARSPKKSKMSLGLVAIALVVCLALGAAGYFLKTRRARASGKKAAKSQVTSKPQQAAPVAMLSLEPFVVNLADPDHSSFLRLQVSLGLNKDLPKASGEGADSPWTPEVRDTILSVVTTWQSSQLSTEEGKAKLKEQLLGAIQRRIPQLGVAQVYFTDFLIQQ